MLPTCALNDTTLRLSVEFSDMLHRHVGRPVSVAGVIGSRGLDALGCRCNRPNLGPRTHTHTHNQEPAAHTCVYVEFRACRNSHQTTALVTHFLRIFPVLSLSLDLFFYYVYSKKHEHVWYDDDGACYYTRMCNNLIKLCTKFPIHTCSTGSYVPTTLNASVCVCA